MKLKAPFPLFDTNEIFPVINGIRNLGRLRIQNQLKEASPKRKKKKSWQVQCGETRGYVRKNVFPFQNYFKYFNNYMISFRDRETTWKAGASFFYVDAGLFTKRKGFGDPCLRSTIQAGLPFLFQFSGSFWFVPWAGKTLQWKCY